MIATAVQLVGIGLLIVCVALLVAVWSVPAAVGVSGALALLLGLWMEREVSDAQGDS